MKNSYAEAGVDVQAGERAVELMKGHVARATRPEVMGGLGGFAGLFDVSALKNYRRPVLATSTDGCGTKVAIAQAMGRYDTIGWDLIGMLVDDLVVVGAEPLFVTDYIACGKLFPERIADIVAGIAQACHEAGAALIGGETAEHPGLMAEDDFDVAGATTGVVEADEMLGPNLVKPGDKLVAMASSGLHANGYSLIRKVFKNADLNQQIAELDKSLGEELLTPTRVYARKLLAMIDAVEMHAASHITGGGLASNLARVMPTGLGATIERDTWQLPPIFDVVAKTGSIGLDDLEQTLNMGVGMIAIVADQDADKAVAHSNAAGVPAWIAGTVAKSNNVTLVGKYR